MVANPVDRFWELAGASPEEAKFFYTGGPLQVAEATWFVSLIGGVTAFETEDGLVLVDSGMRNYAPQMATELRKHTSLPVHTAIFTHGHIDHAHGLVDFLVEGQPPPRIIGHRAMLAHFARYERTPRHNLIINVRQGGRDVQRPLLEFAGKSLTFGRPDMLPDTLYDDRVSQGTNDVGDAFLNLLFSCQWLTSFPFGFWA